MKHDAPELFSDIFKEADKIKASAAEFYALYKHRIEQLEEENARCKEALKIILQEVEGQGGCADRDEIVYQCDQALGDRK
ncbi:MAG: hypothetical protein ACI4TE_02915 [Alphaproteobacteria bacterium]